MSDLQHQLCHFIDSALLVHSHCHTQPSVLGLSHCSYGLVHNTSPNSMSYSPPFQCPNALR